MQYGVYVHFISDLSNHLCYYKVRIAHREYYQRREAFRYSSEISRRISLTELCLRANGDGVLATLKSG